MNTQASSFSGIWKKEHLETEEERKCIGRGQASAWNQSCSSISALINLGPLKRLGQKEEAYHNARAGQGLKQALAQQPQQGDEARK